MSLACASLRHHRAFVAFLACFAVIACDCDDYNTLVEDPATVLVNVVTGGQDLPTSYLLTAQSSDGSLQESLTVNVNGSTTLSDVLVGITVTVTLAQIPANCSVTGQNPQTLTTLAGQQSTVSFQVTCSPLVGGIQVSTTTTGTRLDPDGYTVAAGTQTGSVGVNDSYTFSALAVGSHSVELTGVDANCVVEGENPRDITVAYDQTAQTTFQITCPVDVTVSAPTTGTVLDTDGFTVRVDGADLGTVDTGASEVFGLMPGSRSIELTGLHPGCSVVGDNPQTVTVPTSSPVTVTFQVTCPVMLTVTTATSGTAQDPDGYDLVIDQGTPTDIAINDTKQFVLQPGNHTVQLTDVAETCVVNGNNPRTVNLPTDADAQTDFTINCSGGTTGTLYVQTMTTGWDLPNSFGVSVEEVDQGTILANGMAFLEDIEAGVRAVELTNVPANCSVQQENPQSVTVNVGETANPVFIIACGGILFESNPDGFHRDIFVGHSDGSPGFTRLTSNLGTDQDPAWHPDRTKIAYTCDHGTGGGWGICIRDVTAPMADPPTTVLLGDMANDTDPEWSPDGTKIAFKSDRGGGSGRDIWIMNADGSGLFNVTNSPSSDDEDPSWNPDGTRLVFHSDRIGPENDIYVINIDGTGLVNLTNDPANDDEDGVFSPDGTMIVYMSDRDGGGDEEIWTMNADGTNKVRLTWNNQDDDDPTWSPDGTMIAWTLYDPLLDDEIWIMNADGSNKHVFTQLSTKEDEANWR